MQRGTGGQLRRVRTCPTGLICTSVWALFCDTWDVIDRKQQICLSSSSWRTDQEDCLCHQCSLPERERKWACVSADVFYDTRAGRVKHGRCRECIFRPCCRGAQGDWQTHRSVKCWPVKEKITQWREKRKQLDYVWRSTDKSRFPGRVDSLHAAHDVSLKGNFTSSCTRNRNDWEEISFQTVSKCIQMWSSNTGFVWYFTVWK